jgi:hypothetical protein
MVKKNLSIIVIVILGILLITIVVRVYNRRIANIETNLKSHH